MLPKTHLTLHSRMSGFRLVITPWLFGMWRCFLYNSSVYSCYFLLISFASFRSIAFLSFIVPFFARNVPLVSLIFLKRSLYFPILLFSSFLYLMIDLQHDLMALPLFSAPAHFFSQTLRVYTNIMIVRLNPACCQLLTGPGLTQIISMSAYIINYSTLFTFGRFSL